ncbi:MAG TPA: ATP-binding protein, partial [Flavisolibacter sp.]|nr:ATP-binding protein [Flavisolibacter sp.]
IYQLEKEKLSLLDPQSAVYKQRLTRIEQQRKRDVGKYLGEGAAFLLFILVGAVFVFRSVRRQITLQQQEQNFVMAVTHELKTPLAISRLNLETLQRHNLDESKKARLVQTTLQETLRLDTLINNILILSQMDTRSYKHTKEEINFSDLTLDVVNQFNSRYPLRPIEKKIEPEVELLGDALLLKLLVSNLLENANKYSPEAKPVVVTLQHQNNQVILEVADEGIGIADEEKDVVFQKFYRVGNEQTRKTQGTGLGLYLCKKIAEDHNAFIKLKDNQPSGSIFSVQFSLT